MKILLINANTSKTITGLLLEQARKVAARDTELVAVTARFGGRYVASRATYAIAGHAALDAYAEHGHDADAVVLACFGDPALLALKEVASQAVVGMAEASCLEAAALGGRFAIVTGGERWGPMLSEFVASMGLADRLAVIHTVAPTGGDIARDPERSLNMLVEACQQCIDRHRATSIILGGAGLAGLAARIGARVPVPLIDSLSPAVRRAEQLAGHGGAAVRGAPPMRSEGIETVGLSHRLAMLLGPNSIQ